MESGTDIDYFITGEKNLKETTSFWIRECFFTHEGYGWNAKTLNASKINLYI